jgi:hypothetical protein
MEKMVNPMETERLLEQYCFQTDHLEYWEFAIEMTAYVSFLFPETFLNKFNFILDNPMVCENLRFRQKIVVYLWKLSTYFQTGVEAEIIKGFFQRLATDKEEDIRKIANVALGENKISSSM